MSYPPGTGSDVPRSDTPGQDAGASTPRCYRHPGRETYVSCVRCGRNACPDCLRSAAVGQQCVDCVREGNRGSRQAIGRFGGKVSDTPVVTYTLVALCVATYIVELAYGKIIDYGAMVGAAIDPTINAVIGVAQGDWYRLLTSAFLHEPPGSGIGLTHIIFNMWALIVVGPALERALGRARYLAVYLVSALAGSVLYYLLAPPNGFAIGASGAIFGLFGAWFVLAKRMRLDTRQVVLLIVLNLGITFIVHGIAWQDHVGGLIAGAALTAAYVYAPRVNRTLIQVAATVAILALIVVGVIVRDVNLVHTVMFRL
ncbi:MAG TPA: rhomboid family intramembrane serine protease [Streptosporangiaceae bacterium]|nr:rhomboid family intramembrane serine protease [Streptosporangiaceae bacterium]